MSSHLASIKTLDGTNYDKWVESLTVTLAVMRIDLTLRVDEHPKPTPTSTTDAKSFYEKWEDSNRLCRIVIWHTIDDTIREGVVDNENAKMYLADIGKKFTKHPKAEKGTHVELFSNSLYNGKSGIRNHILKMQKYINKLSSMDVKIGDSQLVWQVIQSLPYQFDSIRSSYNTQESKWSVQQMTSILV